MKKERIIFGASLFTIAFSFNVNAQTCGTPPTCASLGYMQTASDCPASGVKCPFDTTKMYCAETCQVGSILYSDKTCSKKYNSSKFIIAIVVEPNLRLAVALKAEANPLKWADDSTPLAQTNHVDGLNGCSLGNLCPNNGKVNTDTIRAFGVKHGLYYPAIDYCLGYSTMGTQKGDWFLPSMPELQFLRNNEPTIKITTDMLATKSVGVEGVYDGYWSSNESAVTSKAWYFGVSENTYNKSFAQKVRPMMYY